MSDRKARDSREAFIAALRDEDFAWLVRFRAVATGFVRHDNNGLCPDFPGSKSRDPDCELCQWLRETDL